MKNPSPAPAHTGGLWALLLSWRAELAEKAFERRPLEELVGAAVARRDLRGYIGLHTHRDYRVCYRLDGINEVRKSRRLRRRFG